MEIPNESFVLTKKRINITSKLFAFINQGSLIGHITHFELNSI